MEIHNISINEINIPKLQVYEPLIPKIKKVPKLIVDYPACVKVHRNNLFTKIDIDENGTVTAATSSPLTDGAAATLICEENYARENNLNILGRIVSTAVEGCAPDYMGLGPIGASKKALKRANLSADQIDIVELNEAFASQSLACIKDLGIDKNKVNLDGGALALGHPLGATGARITGKAADLLKRENKKYALSTQCIGLGMGIATVIESVN